MADAPTEIELDTQQLNIESKRVYFNLRQNRRGRFLKIAEVNRGNRSTIIIPESGFEAFRDMLDGFIGRVKETPYDESHFGPALGAGAGASESRHTFARDAPEESSSGQQLWVENLPWDTTDEELKTFFEPYGTIEKCEIQMQGSRSRGTAVVRFSTTDEADAAMSSANGEELGGRAMRVRLDRFG